jgi:hypothetical protein
MSSIMPWLLAALAVYGCGKSQGQPKASTSESAATAPMTVAAKSAPSAAVDHKSPVVKLLPTATSAGGSIWQVGTPRMGFSGVGPQRPTINAKSERIYAHQYGLDGMIKAWHGPTGRLLYAAPAYEFFVGPDDSPIWIKAPITGKSGTDSDRVLSADFSVQKGAEPPNLFFSTYEITRNKSKALMSITGELAVHDTSQRFGKTIAEVEPDSQQRLLKSDRDYVFSQDEKSVYWGGNSGILRWDWATDQKVTFLIKKELPPDFKKTATTIEEKAKRMKALESPSFARGADLAAYGLGPTIWLIDLKTGQSKPIIPRPNITYQNLSLALSPTGKYLAIMTKVVAVPDTDDRTKVGDYVGVFEVATGKQISEHQLTDCDRLTYSEIDEVFGCRGSNLVHYIDIRKPPERLLRTIFLDWMGDNGLLLSTGPDSASSKDKPEDWNNWHTTLPILTSTPVAPTVLSGSAPFVRPTAAPKWATGFEQRQGGPWIGFDYKGTSTCKSTFNVWVDAQSAAKPTTRQFRMTCKGADAGWELSHGVAVSMTRQLVTLFDGATGANIGSVTAGATERGTTKLPHIIRLPELSADGKHLTIIRAEPVIIGGDSAYDTKARCKPPSGADAANPFGLSATCSYDLFLDIYAVPLPATLTGTKPAPLARIAHVPIDSNDVILARFNTAGTAVYLGRQDGRINIQVMPASVGATIPPLRTERIHTAAVRQLEFSPTDRYVHSRDELGGEFIWLQ